jgi:hypothetical protein
MHRIEPKPKIKMKPVKITYAVALFIGALACFAVEHVFGTGNESPPRHEQPPQDKTPETAITPENVHALSYTIMPGPAIKMPALVRTERSIEIWSPKGQPGIDLAVPDSLKAGHQTAALEPPLQRRFAERPRYWRNCGWEYGWQRFGT